MLTFSRLCQGQNYRQRNPNLCCYRQAGMTVLHQCMFQAALAPAQGNWKLSPYHWKMLQQPQWDYSNQHHLKWQCISEKPGTGSGCLERGLGSGIIARFGPRLLLPTYVQESSQTTIHRGSPPSPCPPDHCSGLTMHMYPLGLLHLGTCYLLFVTHCNLICFNIALLHFSISSV